MIACGIYLLWKDPLIVSYRERDHALISPWIPRDTNILMHFSWYKSAMSLPSLIIVMFKEKIRGRKIHYMCNSSAELRQLRKFNLSSELCSHNLYLNEQRFMPSDEPKLYDAIYTARMLPYKRLPLAAKVNKLYVATYGSYRGQNGEYDLKQYVPELSRCDHNRVRLNSIEMAKKYNQSLVGLALSKREGGMMACVEYMLCGLPVVSTYCQGGREEFFDSRYVKVVKDNADAVADGVQEMISAHVDPHYVRQETLKKLRNHRVRFCRRIQEIIKNHSKETPSIEWLIDRYFGQSDGINRFYINHRQFDKVEWWKKA